MSSRDMYNSQVAVQLTAPQAITATEDPANGVDLQGFEGALIQIDAGLWTDGTHTFSVEDSDDDSAYSAVAAAQLQGTPPVILGLTNDNKVHQIGYLGFKRYVKVVNTVTAGPSTGLVYGVSVIKGYPRNAPVTQV